MDGGCGLLKRGATRVRRATILKHGKRARKSERGHRAPERSRDAAKRSTKKHQNRGLDPQGDPMEPPAQELELHTRQTDTHGRPNQFFQRYTSLPYPRRHKHVALTDPRNTADRTSARAEWSGGLLGAHVTGHGDWSTRMAEASRAGQAQATRGSERGHRAPERRRDAARRSEAVHQRAGSSSSLEEAAQELDAAAKGKADDDGHGHSHIVVSLSSHTATQCKVFRPQNPGA
jgi:hypothetical protein